MRHSKLGLLIVLCLTTACGLLPPGLTPTSTATPVTPTDIPTSIPDPEPSYRVAAFYYPWYGNTEFDGVYVHWDQAGYNPPQGIGSDFYPALAAYSSIDPNVVAQHFAWLREAGVGGPGSFNNTTQII